jgi:DNA polymerase-3 subunit delta
MVITLTGENSFGLSAALRNLKASFMADYGDMAFVQIDGELTDYDRIREAIQAAPFLAAKKMVVLRSPSAIKQFTDEAEKLLKEVDDTTELIIVEPKLDKRVSYYKYLKKSTDFREFPALDVRTLTKWLVDSAKNNGGTLSLADATFLVDRVGSDQQLLSSELEKLLLYNSQINRKTIELMTDLSVQSTIFELLDAAFAGKTKYALQLYDEQRIQKVDPLAITALMSWQLHVLALLVHAGSRSTDAVASDAKISPFVARKSQTVARKLTKRHIKSYVSDLLAIDVRARREAIDMDEALKLFIMQLG